MSKMNMQELWLNGKIPSPNSLEYQGQNLARNPSWAVGKRPNHNLFGIPASAWDYQQSLRTPTDSQTSG